MKTDSKEGGGGDPAQSESAASPQSGVTQVANSSTGAGAPRSVPNDEVVEVLKTVIDPELYLDIWTLGLVYGVGLDEPGKIHILMTFTTPACPAGPYLIEEVKSKLATIDGVEDVTVEITFSPPWEVSDELKQMLGLY